MQRCTKPGGYNLIVAAMDTDDFPCTVGFPFAFKAGKLRRYYTGWDLLKYNEDVGELHVRMRTATVLNCALQQCWRVKLVNLPICDKAFLRSAFFVLNVKITLR